MATNKEDVLLQIRETKSDLAKALITGNKKLIEQVSVQCTCTLSILCASPESTTELFQDVNTLFFLKEPVLEFSPH